MKTTRFFILMLCMTFLVSILEANVRYEFNTRLQTHSEASKSCRDLGGKLAIPKTDAEFQNMIKALNIDVPSNPQMGVDRWPWIGLTRYGKEWSFGDGTVLGSWNKWADDRPGNDGKNKDCVQVGNFSKQNDTIFYNWKDVDCSYKSEHICEFTLECIDGFHRVGERCLKLVTTRKTWSEAKAHCTENAAILATPQNDSLFRQLIYWNKLAARERNEKHKVWIGMRLGQEIKRDTYLWEDETEYNGTVQYFIRKPTVSSTPLWYRDENSKKQYAKLTTELRNYNQSDSRKLCASIGGKLPEPKNLNELHFIERSFSSGEIWLGMTDMGIEDTWKFTSDKSLVDWDYWEQWDLEDDFKSEPNGGSKENCAVMLRDAYKGRLYNEKKWADRSCDRKIPDVICEKKNNWTTTDPKTGKQYTAITQTQVLSREDNKRFCKSMGGILPEPRTPEENEFVAKLSDSWIWLGMNDTKEENTWVWESDNSNVNWKNWESWQLIQAGIEEPNGQREQNCAIIVKNKFTTYNTSLYNHTAWADMPCTEPSSRTVVCEKEKRQQCVFSLFRATNPRMKAGRCNLRMSSVCEKPMRVPPSLDDGPSDVTVIDGRPADLDCRAKGNPTPIVRWKKDGVNLDPGLAPRGLHTFRPARLTDAGSYSCSATNLLGVASRNFTLTVQEIIWSTWSSYEPCSVSCGGGQKTRKRTCPVVGGCPGQDTESQVCNTEDCPPPEWTNWSSYSQCSMTCGKGHQIRTRKCTDSARVYGGEYCPGVDFVSRECNQPACPVYQSSTIFEQTVPFITNIPGGMTPGRVIYVVGTPQPSSDAKVFIDLYCGPFCSPEDIPLHINVNFKDDQFENMVLSNMKQGEWEIVEPFTSVPFNPNAEFEIKIVCEPSSFKIYVNNKYITEFLHRLNLDRATHIRLSKDIKFSRVQFEELPTVDNIKVMNYFNPILPFERKIPEGMTPGRVIYVVGKSNPNHVQKFRIDLYSGPSVSSTVSSTVSSSVSTSVSSSVSSSVSTSVSTSVSPTISPTISPEDIPLHIAVRFDKDRKFTEMVLNSMKQGEWETEETVTGVTFEPNVEFEMKIVCELSSFKIYVNNKYITEFVHRLKLDKATDLRVGGGTRLTQVRFERQAATDEVRYKVSDDLVTHAEAVASCKRQGGKLMEPKSRDDLVKLRKIEGKLISDTVFIGIETKNGETWSYSSRTHLTTWADWFIQGLDGDDDHDLDSNNDGDNTSCAIYYPNVRDRVHVELIDCKERYKYACEFHGEPIPTMTCLPPYNCHSEQTGRSVCFKCNTGASDRKCKLLDRANENRILMDHDHFNYSSQDKDVNGNSSCLAVVRWGWLFPRGTKKISIAADFWDLAKPRPESYLEESPHMSLFTACMEWMVKCPNENKCIKKEWLCDGIKNCADLWDEQPEHCYTEWEVTVYTGWQHTDGSVFIQIYGPNDHTKEVELDNAGIDDFELMEVGSTFNIKAKDVGFPKKIKIRHKSERDTWDLIDVRLKQKGHVKYWLDDQSEFWYPINKAMGKVEEAFANLDLGESMGWVDWIYSLYTHFSPGSETDGEVYVSIYGKDGPGHEISYRYTDVKNTERWLLWYVTPFVKRQASKNLGIPRKMQIRFQRRICPQNRMPAYGESVRGGPCEFPEPAEGWHGKHMELSRPGKKTKLVYPIDRWMCDDTRIFAYLDFHTSHFTYRDLDGCTKDRPVKCQNEGFCIKKKWICDGDKDCADGWDEMNCPECAWDYTKCPNEDKCFPSNRICNDQNDCKDGWDENDEMCAVEYTMRVYTADVDQAGYDDAIRMQIIGSAGKTRELNFPDGMKDRFEQGQVDVFNIKVREVGIPWKMKIWLQEKDNIRHLGGPWKLDKIELEQVGVKVYKFRIERWFCAGTPRIEYAENIENSWAISLRYYGHGGPRCFDYVEYEKCRLPWNHVCPAGQFKKTLPRGIPGWFPTVECCCY